MFWAKTNIELRAQLATLGTRGFSRVRRGALLAEDTSGEAAVALKTRKWKPRMKSLWDPGYPLAQLTDFSFSSPDSGKLLLVSAGQG